MTMAARVTGMVVMVGNATREFLLPPLRYSRTALGQEPFVLGQATKRKRGVRYEANGNDFNTKWTT